MAKLQSEWFLFLMTGILAGAAANLKGQDSFEIVTGKAFEAAIPRDFYLEGNAIPTEKRNAVLLKDTAGSRLLCAVLDTSGYSSQIQNKYLGMLISERKASVGGIRVEPGSYGFGMEKPPATVIADAKFFLYNQAGQKVGECIAKKDTRLGMPRPLQVVPKERQIRLYLGVYWIEIGP